MGLSKTDSGDIHCSMCGNSFSVPVVAELIIQALYHERFLASPATVGECWGDPCLEDLSYLEALTGKKFIDINADDVHVLAYLDDVIVVAPAAVAGEV